MTYTDFEVHGSGTAPTLRPAKKRARPPVNFKLQHYTHFPLTMSRQCWRRGIISGLFFAFRLQGTVNNTYSKFNQQVATRIEYLVDCGLLKAIRIMPG